MEKRRRKKKNVDLFPQPRCSYSHYERDKHSHQCWPDTIVFSHKDRQQLAGVRLCWDASLEPSSKLQLKRCGAHKESKSRSWTSHAAAAASPPNVLHLKRLSRGRRVDELDRPSGFATDRDATKESVCAEQKAAGDWSQRSAIGEARREKTRNGAAGFFFFLNTAAIVHERVDLAILLVLQPEWRNEVAFIKRPGQVWVLKCLLACL